MPISIKTDKHLTKRIEKMAERLKISPTDFGLFSIVKCLEDLENLERIVAAPEIRFQLIDLMALHKLGRLPAEDLAGEMIALLAMPKDSAWTPEVE